jgi:hypothetical protein
LKFLIERLIKSDRIEWNPNKGSKNLEDKLWFWTGRAQEKAQGRNLTSWGEAS